MTQDGLGNFSSLGPNAAREILSKHGAEKLIRILGPYFGGSIPATLAAASSIYTDYTVRASEAERREAYEKFSKELPRLVNLVRPKNVSVISGAFNSDLRYMNAFAGAAFTGITLAVKKGIDAINRIGTALDAIKGELSIQTIGNVQGWGEGGLGSHIHRLVLMEIEKSHFQDGMHLFYVWTPGNTTWHARFTERNREQPLGSRFGGYHDDLGTICNLMWSNRKTLMETVTHGKDAIFHLLVPSFETFVIDDPIIFHDSLHPLVVKGDIYRGHPLVWLNPALARDRLIFQDIGVLPDINNKVMDNGMKAFLGCWVSGAACAVTTIAGATLFPPLLVYESYIASAFVSSWFAGMSSVVGTMGALAYNDLTAPTPQVLGPPLFLYSGT